MVFANLQPMLIEMGHATPQVNAIAKEDLLKAIVQLDLVFVVYSL